MSGMQGDTLFFPSTGKTVDSTTVDGDGYVYGDWLDIATSHRFAIHSFIANAGGTLVGKVYVQVGNFDKSIITNVAFTDGEGADADYISVASATDFTHTFNCADVNSPWVRLAILRTSGSSEANAAVADIFRKRSR